MSDPQAVVELRAEGIVRAMLQVWFEVATGLRDRHQLRGFAGIGCLESLLESGRLPGPPTVRTVILSEPGRLMWVSGTVMLRDRLVAVSAQVIDMRLLKRVEVL